MTLFSTTSRLLLVVEFASLVANGRATVHELANRQFSGLPGSDLPSPENFLRRAFHRCMPSPIKFGLVARTNTYIAIVVGDFLYIDGGELTQYVGTVNGLTVLTGMAISRRRSG